MITFRKQAKLTKLRDLNIGEACITEDGKILLTITNDDGRYVVNLVTSKFWKPSESLLNSFVTKIKITADYEVV